jgi:CheY-like chemotaxis protein
MDLEMPGESWIGVWTIRRMVADHHAVMDGLTALRHIREEEAAGTLALNLVIALSESWSWSR